MNNNEELKKITVENNGETKTFTYSKELEETLMKHQRIVASYVLKDAVKWAMKMEEIDELKDKELLDAAERMRLCLVQEPNGGWTYRNPSITSYPTIRDAIRAAIAAARKEQS